MTDIRVEPPDESGGWRNQPRLRALRRRPPTGVVALVSALIGGAAVAVYMDRPVEVVDAGPSVLRVNPEPESWLNLSVDDRQPPVPSGEQDRMLARHPAEATLTAPLALGEENLVALPPGVYHVRASCSAETVPPPDGPAWFTIEIVDPSTYEPAPESSAGRDQADLVCDGEPHTVAAGMTVAGYQALVVQHYTAFDAQAEGVDGPTGRAVPGVFVAVSFTQPR